MESSPPTTTTPLKTEQVIKAVTSLLKWNTTHNPNPDYIYLVLTLYAIPKDYRPPTQHPFRIPLPHPLHSPHDPTFRTCLFVPDKHSHSTKLKIESELLPINHVIKLSTLRSHYSSFDAKKTKLLDSYDAFLVDRKVAPTLERMLGRCFSKRGKRPIGIECGRDGWREQIEAAVGSAYLEVKSGRVCCVVKVARAGMGRDKIVDNVVAAVGGVVAVVPKKWRNVRALHLKFSESLALPIYEGEMEEMEEGGVGEKRKTGVDKDVKVLEQFGGLKNKKRKV